MNSAAGTFGENDVMLAGALAASAGIALEYLELNRELAAERLRVARVDGEARRRLARELHDGVLQTLANATLGIEIAKRRSPGDPAAALLHLEDTRKILQRAQAELRDILFSLRPLALEHEGLPGALRALAERLGDAPGSRVSMGRSTSVTRHQPEVEGGAFTIAREAVNNAIKTHAPTVTIDVEDVEGGTLLTVADDGGGFDVEQTLATYASRGSLGLLQMRETARLIGATLEIDSAPGHGTCVRLLLLTPR